MIRPSKNALRILAIFTAFGTPVFGQSENASYEYWKGLLEDPMVWGLAIAISFLILALLAINKSLNTIKEITLRATNPNYDAEAAEAHEESSIMAALTDAVPVEQEAEIMLDHEYDGIKELDNNLPPWWLYGFYISIAWAIGYMFYFEFLGIGMGQEERYEAQMAQAEMEVEAYLATAANLVDETSVTMIMDDGRLAKGQKIFVQNCAACHLADGGGIVGPNLTDEYWIHGGGIKNVFTTIKYGVPEKGMIAWKDQLNASQMQDVASYILTLQGMTPANPKAPEGELWVEEASAEETPADGEAPAEGAEETVDEATEATPAESAE